MLAALALLCVASSPPPQGELLFPVGPAAPGTIAVRVVDRHRIPLPGATVCGTAEVAGGAQWFSDAGGRGAALGVLEPATADGAGRAVLAAPDGAWCGVVAEAPGFAAAACRPLFAGHAYEIVLDQGAALVVVCADPDGRPVEAELALEHHVFPELPGHAGTLRRARTGPDATAEVLQVPRGRTVVHARARDGARGLAELQVGSAWRTNALFGEAGVARITLRPTVERTLPVADAAGAPVPGLRAALGAFGPSEWVTAEVVEGGVRVAGLPGEGADGAEWLAPCTLRVWAPGWRALAFQLSADSPPSAWTEPAPLAPAAPLPAAPGPGVLWTPLDPLDVAPWERSELALDGSASLRPAAEFAVAGALVDGGRVGAWLRAEFGDGECALDWLAPGSLRIEATVDDAPCANALLAFELVAGSVGGALPGGLASREFAFADPAGRCSLNGLLPGRYEVRLSSPYLDHATSRAFVEVQAGSETVVLLRATRGVTLRGRVVDAQGAPIGAGTVLVLGEGRTTVGDGRLAVGADGRFAVPGLVAGEAYTLLWEEDDLRPLTIARFPELPPLRAVRTATVGLAGPHTEPVTIVVGA